MEIGDGRASTTMCGTHVGPEGGTVAESRDNKGPQCYPGICHTAVLLH